MSVIVHKPGYALLRYFTELRSIYHKLGELIYRDRLTVQILCTA